MGTFRSSDGNNVNIEVNFLLYNKYSLNTAASVSASNAVSKVAAPERRNMGMANVLESLNELAPARIVLVVFSIPLAKNDQ